MNKPFVLSMLAASLVMSQPVNAKLYKWVDDNGHIHYGDKIPAEYSRNQHEVLNNRGDTIKSISRAKSKEELSAERIANAAEEDRKNKERLIKLEAARQDKLLLDTFSNQRDIIVMREDKLESLAANLRLTQSRNKQLEAQLRKVSARIENLESSKRKVPESLTKQVEMIGQQMDKNNNAIARKTKEMTEVKTQFEKDLLRFRKLKGITTPRPDLNNAQQVDTDSSNDSQDISKADVEKLLAQMDKAVNNLDADAVANTMASDIEIVMDMPSQGNTDTLKMDKQQYLTVLKQGWSALTDYSYKRINTSIDVQGGKAIVSSEFEEQMTVQGQKIAGTSKSKATVEWVNGKLLFTKLVANASM